MSVIRFPTNVDLRRVPTPTPTLAQRIRNFFNPPKKAPVFEIKNPRFLLAKRRAQRRA